MAKSPGKGVKIRKAPICYRQCVWMVVVHGGYKYYVGSRRAAWSMADRFLRQHRRVYGVARYA